MKLSVYSIFNGANELIFEQIKEGDNVTYFKDYESDPLFEMYCSFDGDNLIEEKEHEGGSEMNRTTYSYDAYGKMVESCSFIEGEAFETTKFSKEDNVELALTADDEEETRKVVTTHEENLIKQEYFEFGELVQVRLEESYPEENSKSIKVYSGHGDYLGGGKEFKDEQGRLKKVENYNAYGDLEMDMSYTFGKIEGSDKEEIIEVLTTDYTSGKLEFHTKLTYHKGRVSKVEVINDRDEVVELHERFFNEQNEVIEEKGFSNGLFNGFDRLYIKHPEYHVKLEYSN